MATFSSGSGYDLYTTTWSPEGRVYQVEYALKHVDSKGLLGLGLRCKDGVVLAHQVEMLHTLVKYPSPTFNVIHAIEDNMMMSFTGMNPDGLCLVNRARDEAQSWKDKFGSVIPCRVLVDRLSLYISQFTEYYSLRPFGASLFITQYNDDVPKLYTINAAAESFGYHAVAMGGSEKQTAKTELEKLVGDSEVEVEQGIYELIKVLKKCYDPNSSKKVELEVCYISAATGSFTRVDFDVIKEMEARADAELEDEDDMDEDDDEDEDEDENEDEN